MSSPSPTPYEPLSGDDLPQVGSVLPRDLFVKLPNAGRFIRYACAGDVWDERQQKIVASHTDPTLYRNVSSEPFVGSTVSVDDLDREPLVEEAPPEIQVLNDTVDKDLKQVFKLLGSPNEEDVPKTIKAMEELSQQIISVVAPDVENLKESILQQAKYIGVMTDAAAITSIAVLIALSHGFDSRKVFRDLSMSVLLMDAPLADVPEETVHAYYRERPGVPSTAWEEIRRHPARAHEVVSTKLKTVTDSILQMILNHHELYNGQGYPRKIRSETLPPVVRSLSLAVDVFERMKREKLKGNEIDLIAALEELKEADVEPHLRRHNQKLVQQSYSFVLASDLSSAKS